MMTLISRAITVARVGSRGQSVPRGVANRIATARGTPVERHVPELGAAFGRVQAAADASGSQSELWSYEIKHGRLTPVRYGISCDVQLWSTTGLAVEFASSRLRRDH
jgi:hypothetical protein